MYDAIAGSSGFYASPVAPEARSRMNIPFTIPARPELEKDFVAEATKAGMVRFGPACASQNRRLFETCEVFMLACLSVGRGMLACRVLN